MTGTLAELWLAAAVFILGHFGISSTPLRDVLVRRLGEQPYNGLFSLLAVAALAWLIVAYNAAPPGPWLWSAAAAGPYLAIVTLPVAVLLLVGGVSQPNPTATGGERHLDGARPARGALRITRHPVMWAVGLWALTHVVANGSLRDIVFFGSFAVLALAGTLFIDARHRARRGEAFARFAEATSNLPFLAIATGRQSLVKAVRELGPIRLVVVVALYGALLHLHTWMFGAPPYPPA
jgi:uncharacterized membrane protein